MIFALLSSRSGCAHCRGAARGCIRARPLRPARLMHIFPRFTLWFCPADASFHTRFCRALSSPPEARDDVQRSPTLPLHPATAPRAPPYTEILLPEVNLRRRTKRLVPPEASSQPNDHLPLSKSQGKSPPPSSSIPGPGMMPGLGCRGRGPPDFCTDGGWTEAIGLGNSPERSGWRGQDCAVAGHPCGEMPPFFSLRRSLGPDGR